MSKDCDLFSIWKSHKHLSSDYKPLMKLIPSFNTHIQKACNLGQTFLSVDMFVG